MQSAKEILTELRESAVQTKRPCRVSKPIGNIRVILDMLTFTKGLWIIDTGRGKPFTTESVLEAEIKLDEMLKEVEVAA